MSRNRRWTLLAIAALAVLVAAALWMFWPGSLSDGEQALVGVWRFRWDGATEGVPLEYEFKPDRSCVMHSLDPKTVTRIGKSTQSSWRRDGDVLVIRHPNMTTRPAWDLFGWRGYAEEVLELTPDGAGRFRYVGIIEPAKAPNVTGVMTRKD